MSGFVLGAAFALFGVGSALFFASAAYLLKAPNSGVFRFMFIAVALVILAATSGNMAYLARATNLTTEDVSTLAPIFDYILYAISAVFTLFVAYYILGILAGGVNFAMSFLSDDGLQLRKGRLDEDEDRIIKY